MKSVFEIVQAMSGQKNVIVIPVPFLEFFSGDQQAHALGAVLNQLVFWSGVSSSAGDGWFYKSHEELADEIKGLSGEEQARRLVNKLRTKYFPGIIETKAKKVNGTPVTHYRIDGEALLLKIFPDKTETSKSTNGNVESAESKRRNCGMENAEMQVPGNVESEVSYLYTDLKTDHNLQINTDCSSQNSGESSDNPLNNFLTRNPDAAIYSANGQKWGTQDDLDCAKWISERRKGVFAELGLKEPKEPNFTEWANDVRLMREIDGHSHREICALYKRVAADNFWRKNIQSTRSLRDSWDDLTLRLAETQQLKPSVDIVARENAYTRIICSRSKPQTRTEEIARDLAGKAGLRGMKEFDARRAWVGIWSQATEQAAKEREAA